MVFYVTYISSSDHDSCTVWTEANSKEEAINNIKNEYWDIERIVSCSKR